MKLTKYQEEGVSFLTADDLPHKLLADDMGLGKTAQAITAAKALNAKNIVVLCPAAVKYNWLKEIALWWPERQHDVQIAEGGKYRFTEKPILIANYDLLVVRKPPRQRLSFFQGIKKWMADNKVEVLILDEAHFLKNRTAKRTKAIFSVYGLIHFTARSFLLTGTPVLNRPSELFVFLRVLYATAIKGYEDFHSFGVRYCRAFLRDGIWDYSGASNIEELRDKIAPFYLRRLKTEVADQLPALRISEIEIDAPIPYEKLEEIETLPLATARQELAMLKLPYCLPLIAEVVEEYGKKVVIFAQHHKIMEAVAEYFSHVGVVAYNGRMSNSSKQAALDEFVYNESCRVFIGQINACGTGVNGLQKVASQIFFIEADWSPALIDQAMGRLHRIGQSEMVNAYHFTLPNTLEQKMQETLGRKRDVINQLITHESGENTMTGTTKEVTELSLVLEKLDRIIELMEKPLTETLAEIIDDQNEVKAKPKTKTKAKAEEPTEKPAEESKPEPVAEETTSKEKVEKITKDALRQMANTFVMVSEGEEREDRKRKVRDVISTYGAKIEDAKDEDLDALAAELNTLFETYSFEGVDGGF